MQRSWRAAHGIVLLCVIGGLNGLIDVSARRPARIIWPTGCFSACHSHMSRVCCADAATASSEQRTIGEISFFAVSTWRREGARGLGGMVVRCHGGRVAR